MSQAVDHITQYRTSLMRLMPRGYAWPKNKGTVQYAWVDALAQQYNEFENHTVRTMEQCWPHRTCNRLSEWFGATGLPDSCFPGATRAETRDQVLARLQGLAGLKYDDSSPAAPGFIRYLCQRLGYDVEVWYNTPFRCGRNRVGQRLGALDGVLNVRVNRVSEPFRVGRNRVGQRLILASKTGEELVCYLKRIVPARFAIRVIFNEV